MLESLFHKVAGLQEKETKTQVFSCVNIAKYLKHVSVIFYQCFIFSPNDSSSKTMKNVCSRYIQIYVIFPIPFHTFRIQKANGSGIIYDVMNWLA